MLKRLTLKNFVHFPEEQTLNFNENGSYFFIGENRSGKSCAFEAIRRCMSLSKNFFLSSSHDKTKHSVVICKYTNESKTNESKTNESKTDIFSCYVRYPLEESDGSEAVIAKLAFKLPMEKKLIVHVDLVKLNKDGYPVNKAFNMDQKLFRTFREEIIEKDVPTEGFANFVDANVFKTKRFDLFRSDESELDYDESTGCEYFLKKNVDVQVVITDPMRSISPVQWTNSKKLENVHRTKKGVTFHTEMMDRSEVLSWYLESKDISDVEKATECQYFDTLTEGSGITFKKGENMIEVVDNGNIVSLEKAPEGIFEAKVCSILLAIQQFKTICLEEPGRGMHTQMIERLRDLVLKTIQDKTVIIISHMPTFLTTWNVEHIFFFRISRDADHHGTFTVVGGKKLLLPPEGKESTDENKTRRMITNHSLATIFFARRVLLVEGESDVMFMSAVRSILLIDEKLLEQLIATTKFDVKQEQVCRYLSSLHILPLKGEKNKLSLENVGNILGLERYFILDFDALQENSKDGRSTKQFFGKFKRIKYLEKEFNKQKVEVLEKEGMFVWAIPLARTTDSVGTIEDALLDLIEADKNMDTASDNLETIFRNNNAQLSRWSRGKKKRPEHKLFSSRDLTEGNIENVVTAVIRSCIKHDQTDVFRLMKFLLKAAKESGSNKEDRRTGPTCTQSTTSELRTVQPSTSMEDTGRQTRKRKYGDTEGHGKGSSRTGQSKAKKTK